MMENYIRISIGQNLRRRLRRTFHLLIPPGISCANNNSKVPIDKPVTW